ncbi:hypothetical protein CPC08DRAFT_733402 [Agrocybe pediades]|nr:hypothetical protein CPC08DRAFT_733402 [Agrocybe pediades]
MEEERQAQHLKHLLRVSADRLEQEMRRADDANLKAQFLELREQEVLSRVKAVEKLNLELREEVLRLERDTREAQMSLEASQREMRRLHEDVEEARMELEATQHSERKAQEQLQQYKAAVRNLEEQARDRLADMQRALDQCYNDGREDGYDEGYDAGYEEGRRARKKKTKRVLVDDREDIFNSYKDILLITSVHTLFLDYTTMPPRKLPKDLPKLPLSVFTPPSSSAADSFPIPPSPNSLHPAAVIDANVVSKDTTYSQWKKEAGPALAEKIKGVVLALPSSEIPNALNAAEKNPQILSYIVPFDLEKADPSIEALIASANAPVALSTVFTREATSAAVDGLRWALQRGVPVDIDIQATLSDSLLESFEDLTAKASDGLEHVPPIVVSNILPPPHDLELPIVRLMNHPTYLAFQAQVGALSLIPQVHVKFLPPAWDAPTPQTPFPGSPIEAADTQQLKEWKRRIKMYLAPVFEAFGSERIIFGSSPSSSSRTPSNVADWYEIARESLAELGLEQDVIDGVFAGNAARVYGKTTGKS